MERRLIVPDAHIPAHDKRAWEILLAVARDYRPDRTIIIGDFCDTASLTHHPKREARVVRFVDEVAATNECLDQLQKDSRETYLLEGNHEGWLQSFMAEQPTLEGAFTIPGALRLAARGIRWVSLREQDNFSIGPVAYLHGVWAGVNATRKHAEVWGPKTNCRYVVHGHTHSLDAASSSAGYYARCCGFLGDATNIAFGYRKGTPSPWALGFLLQDVQGELVQDTEVRIVGGKALVNGMTY